MVIKFIYKLIKLIRYKKVTQTIMIFYTYKTDKYNSILLGSNLC